ncbi:hypothetical protein [Secundilactobacillus folii]|uniref:Extracellular protein n=1 Tax=Secundilactobacillus folii TaxID=2678357 RepID=A0A7X3C3Y3_9LACO|nr:hypothetical protein [Secundilactobacillus folii]MTV82814.1 hypothetical protein [Secundilactobacillus folii]
MKKWLKLCVATLALVLGYTVTSTVNAHASSFTYFGGDGSKTYHHKVISYQKYTLNKTFYNSNLDVGDTSTGSTKNGKIQLYHLYVFHVSPKVSRYQTWVKLTGHVYNYNNAPANNVWGATNMDGITQKYVLQIQDSTPAGYTFSKGTSKSPILFSKKGLAPGDDEGFQLLAHSKTATQRLGQTTINLFMVGHYKDLKLNLK